MFLGLIKVTSLGSIIAQILSVKRGIFKGYLRSCFPWQCSDFRMLWHRILIGLQNFLPLYFVHDQPGLLMLEHMSLCHCVSKLKNLSISTTSPFVVEYLFISLFDFICLLCVDMFHFCVLEGKCLCLYSNSFSIRPCSSLSLLSTIECDLLLLLVYTVSPWWHQRAIDIVGRKWIWC